MLNHNSIIHLIISLTLTLLQGSFNTQLRVYIIHTLSVNLTPGILLCTIPDLAQKLMHLLMETTSQHLFP